jgi:hypothetical protein
MDSIMQDQVPQTQLARLIVPKQQLIDLVQEDVQTNAVPVKGFQMNTIMADIAPTSIQHKQAQSNIKFGYSIIDKAKLIDFFDGNVVCKQCKNYVSVIHNFDVGPSFRLTMLCKYCNRLSVFDSCYNLIDANKHFVAAFQLSSIDYAEYYKFSTLLGMCPLSKKTYLQYGYTVWNAAEEVAEEVMEEELEKTIMRAIYSQIWGIAKLFPPELTAIIYSYINKWGEYLPLHVAFDGRYSSRRNAYECTVTLIDRISDNVIKRMHVVRKRANDTRFDVGLYVGAAKCTESYAVGELIDQLQSRLVFGSLKMFLATFCHDHDSSASAIVNKKQLEFFHAPLSTRQMIDVLEEPLVEESVLIDGANKNEVVHVAPNVTYDKNHAAVNVGKHVSKFASRLGAQSSRAFLKCCNLKNRSLTERQQILRNYPNHWAGDHTNCLQCNSNVKPMLDLSKPKDKIKYEFLIIYFNKLAEILPNYSHSAHTNSNESFNNMVTITAPKRKDYLRTIRGRLDLQAVRKNLGEMGLVRVLEKAGVAVHSSTIALLQKKQEQREDDAKRKKTNRYKQQRRENKENNRSLHSSVDNSKHSYKNLQEEKPKRGRKRRAETDQVENAPEKKKRKTPICKSCSMPVTKEHHNFIRKGKRVCKNNSAKDK